MATYARRYHFGTGSPLLPRAVLAVALLLLAVWTAWLAFFTALIAVPVIAIAALAAKLARGRIPPERPARFDGPVIEGEYRVIPPER